MRHTLMSLSKSKGVESNGSPEHNGDLELVFKHNVSTAYVTIPANEHITGNATGPNIQQNNNNYVKHIILL